jgi:predicted nucleic acid-binding protein
MKKAIIDTGVIIAFFDESDKYCEAVIIVIVTEPVFL